MSAVIRPCSDASVIERVDNDNLRIVRADLRNKPALSVVVTDTDVVIHLAADKSGDFYDQFASTVIATENLIQAMAGNNIRRLILASTFSVYDYSAIPAGTVLDEQSPLERHPELRDAYCQSKILQERVAREAADRDDIDLTILRPGVVYAAPEYLWTARLGVSWNASSWIIRTGAFAQLPLTHVENCALAFVLAAERPDSIGEILNIVDDDRPTQGSYLKLLKRHGWIKSRVIPLNRQLMLLLVGLAALANRMCFQGRAKVPAILRRRAVHARIKPLRYTNDRIKDKLEWRPRITLNDALPGRTELGVMDETPAVQERASHQQPVLQES